MNKNFDTGSTFELQLLNGLGYCYFKFSDFRIKDPNLLLIRVFDYTSKTPVKSLNDIDLNNLLFGANCFVGTFPKNKKEFGLRYLGQTVHSFDNFVPDFAKLKSIIELRKETNPLDVKWCPVVYFKDMPICEYKSICHLEQYCLVSIIDIQIRATMEILRKKNIDIGSVFDLENPIYSNHYFSILNIMEYSKISTNKKDIALGYENIIRLF
jgi:hypothetical protein